MPILHQGTHVCNSCQAEFDWIHFELTCQKLLSGRWCGDQRPLCGPAAGDCQSVEFGFITTV